MIEIISQRHVRPTRLQCRVRVLTSQTHKNTPPPSTARPASLGFAKAARASQPPKRATAHREDTRTPWRRLRCRPCGALSFSRPRRGRRWRLGPEPSSIPKHNARSLFALCKMSPRYGAGDPRRARRDGGYLPSKTAPLFFLSCTEPNVIQRAHRDDYELISLHTHTSACLALCRPFTARLRPLRCNASTRKC